MCLRSPAGLAAVLLGSFVSIGCGGSSAEVLECSFIPAEKPTDVISDCGARDGAGNVVIRVESLRTVEFVDGRPRALSIDEDLYYVSPTGRAAPVIAHDNGADPFTEGLARTSAGGKIGFIDEALDVVIPPRWDFAFPFERGLAVVCNGCIELPAGEHSELVGGLWGYIDLRGNVILPVEYERDALPPRDVIPRTDDP